MILVIGGSFQGKKAYAAKICAGGPVFTDLQNEIRNLMKEGKDPESLIRQILADPPAVITLDEVGCGIVSIEKEERDYREAVGQAGQLLAAAAKEVYRVQCGIATRIK